MARLRYLLAGALFGQAIRLALVGARRGLEDRAIADLYRTLATGETASDRAERFTTEELEPAARPRLELRR